MLRFPTPLEPARFIRRPNRFVLEAEQDGRRISVRCPSPGSLRELLLPGAELRVWRPDNPKRRTDATLVLIRSGRRWVSIDTQLPNRLMAAHLDAGLLPPFAGAVSIQREVPIGQSRFDFAVQRPRRKRQIIEVKCCNLLIGRTGYFPDSVSARATKHLKELAQLTQSGAAEGWAVFLITRDDAEECRPYAAGDPVFAAAMSEAAAAGVQFLAVTHKVTLKGIAFDRLVPVFPL